MNTQRDTRTSKSGWSAPNRTRHACLGRAAIVMLALMTSAMAANARAQFTSGEVPISGPYHPAFSSLDSQVTQYMANNQISAMVVGIMSGSRVMYERGFGWKDYAGGDLTPIAENSVMRVASLTKPIIASAAYRLADEAVLPHPAKVFAFGQQPPTGILPADEYFPLGGPLGDPRLLDITVFNLVMHQGGWDRNITFDPRFGALFIANQLGIDPPPGEVSTVQFMMSQPLDYTPGTSSGLCNGPYCYSNFGFTLIGLMIEEVTGQDCFGYIHQNIMSTWGGSSVELIHGRTFAAEQDYREPYYESDLNPTTNVFDPSGPAVEWPYGGWAHEDLGSAGDAVTNTVTLLNFLDRYKVFTSYASGAGGIIGQPLSQINLTSGWTAHTGSLEGTNAVAHQDFGADDLRIAVICNRRKTSTDDSFVVDVRDLVEDLVNAPGFSWPTTYATDNWVDFAAPVNGNGTFQSPKQSLAGIYSNVQQFGRIKIKPGSTGWTGTITQNVRLAAPIGPVVIGQ